MDLNSNLKRWQRDPVAFISECLYDPETKKPFVLYEAQVRFLREALMIAPDERLPYSELVYSAPKKSGKTALAAMIVLYVIIVFGRPVRRSVLLGE